MDIKDTKLINLIRTFDKNEIIELEKFINSPFFNNSAQLTEFWVLLKEDHPEYNNLSKAKIFEHFYGKQEYKDKKIRDLLSRMLELSREFIVQSELRKRKFLKYELEMNRYIFSGLENHYKTVNKDFEKLLNSGNIYEEDFLYSRYLLSKNENKFRDLIEFNDFEETSDRTLKGEYDDFLNYSIYKILYFTLIFIIRNYYLKNETNYEFSEFVYSFLKKYPRDKYPVFGILVLILDLYKTENEKFSQKDVEIYREITAKLIEHKDNISRELQILIYVYLVNYSRVKSLGTKNYFSDEFYRLLKFVYENNLYPRKGKYLQDSIYIFIATEALLRKDFEWAEDFIERFKTDLMPELRMNAYIFCMANLNYRKSDYSTALKYLIRVSIDNIYYQLKVKNLQLKIHFELGDYEMCRSVIDSFRHFLSSVNEFPEFIKERFVNYINFTSRLAKIGLEETSKNLYEIAGEIRDFPASKLESKTWLLNQAEMLKSKNYK